MILISNLWLTTNGSSQTFVGLNYSLLSINNGDEGGSVFDFELGKKVDYKLIQFSYTGSLLIGNIERDHFNLFFGLGGDGDNQSVIEMKQSYLYGINIGGQLSLFKALISPYISAKIGIDYLLLGQKKYRIQNSDLIVTEKETVEFGFSPTVGFGFIFGGTNPINVKLGVEAGKIKSTPILELGLGILYAF